jgi:hypothetical protein
MKSSRLPALAFALSVLISLGAKGEHFIIPEDIKIHTQISKSGLNRICSPPYRIIQVTGDDSKFALKYDPDGSNIYIMPLEKVGEHIEISIKNTAGRVQDFDFEVANITGKQIRLETKARQQSCLCETHDAKAGRNQEVLEMLEVMKRQEEGKFYVKAVSVNLDNSGPFSIKQTYLYRWQDLAGGIFEVTNKGKREAEFEVNSFAGRFDRVLASYADRLILKRGKKTRIFIVQHQSRNMD